jgi:hypothetical protein
VLSLLGVVASRATSPSGQVGADSLKDSGRDVAASGRLKACIGFDDAPGWRRRAIADVTGVTYRPFSMVPKLSVLEHIFEP